MSGAERPRPAGDVPPRIGAVVLSGGGRPEHLERALRSLLDQDGVDLDVVLVANGWQPDGLPDRVRALALPRDLGIPAGRNAGVPEVSGELLFFLDDDASLEDPGALARAAAELRAHPGTGLLQLRVRALEGGPGPRDWVPRLRAADPERGGEVTAVWEGAVLLPRAVFEEVGGWPGEFRYVHEGVDLAWRVMDAGHRVRYTGAAAVRHPLPVPDPVRHRYSTYFAARNRVWLARRHLPAPLGAVYVASFALRTAPQLRARRELRAALRGYRDGLRRPCGPRRPLRARTLWRMTRAGRPPII